ncbi:MAG: ribonuclease HII [Desulfobulbus sp.]|nr:MAG: ribonuclease HII [Desulfobulbus sp.]RUM41023.1 MAG: ribonuclease HII [Desulfobulbus sp.]
MNKKASASFAFLSSLHPTGDTFSYERNLFKHGYFVVGGVDEAGRGPLAGPVVAGCVVLPDDCDYTLYKDSKKLTARKRSQLFRTLYDSDAAIGVGIATASEIDEINILQASLLAMKRAVRECTDMAGINLDFLLVDGKFTVPMELPQKPLIKGESKSASIAAASIIAKVTRDKMMAEYHEEYPVYNFVQHQGYPTKAHRQAIADFGPSPLHRKTFKGVKEFLQGKDSGTNIHQVELW